MKDYKFKIYGHRTERLSVRPADNHQSAMIGLMEEIEQNSGWYWDIKTNTYFQVVQITEMTND